MQGRTSSAQWVTKFGVSYSPDGVRWIDVKGPNEGDFDGCGDSHTVITCSMPQVFECVAMRVIILAYHEYPSLRFEVTGYPIKD